MTASAHLRGSGTAIAGIVLAGGRSTRMGTDKATLVVDGERMVDRVIRCMHEATIAPIVVSGPFIDGLTPAVATVADDSPAEGPLGGVASAWRSVHELNAAEWIAVLSCDLPNVQSESIAALIGRLDADVDAVVAHDGERPQPLFAIYRSTRVEEMSAAFANGARSIRALAGDWEVTEVPMSPALVGDADCPDDLGSFQVEWPEEPKASQRAE